MLNLEENSKVVARVAAGPDIVPAALAERPDVAMLDIDLPGLDGLTAAAELHERMPACRGGGAPMVVTPFFHSPAQFPSSFSWAGVSGRQLLWSGLEVERLRSNSRISSPISA